MSCFRERGRSAAIMLIYTICVTKQWHYFNAVFISSGFTHHIVWIDQVRASVMIRPKSPRCPPGCLCCQVNDKWSTSTEIFRSQKHFQSLEKDLLYYEKLGPDGKRDNLQKQQKYERMRRHLTIQHEAYLATLQWQFEPTAKTKKRTQMFGRVEHHNLSGQTDTYNINLYKTTNIDRT